MSFPSSTVAFFERIGGGGGDLGQREKTSQDAMGEAGGAADVSTARVRLESHPRALLIASLANLGISFNVVNIDLAMKILRELHTESSAGESLVKAAAIFGMMAGQVIFGTLGDIVGRELALAYTLLVCFLGAAGSALTFGTGVFHQLFFWRVVLGIGAGGVYPLAATLARASGVQFFNRGARGGTDGDDEEDSGGTAVAIMFSMQGVGYLVARVTGYALVCLLPDNMEMAWRLLLGLGAVPPLMVVAMIGLSFAQERHYDLVQFVEEGERGEREASLDGPHASNLVRVWMALPEKNRLIHKLIGTAGSWFLFDVTFYGNQLYQGDVLEGVFGAAQTARAEAAQHIALELVGLPGYFVTVALVSSMGPKRIQIQGFIVCAILFAVLGLGFEPLKNKPYALLGLYSLTFFFANFGPNSTTFILPSLTFPDQVRASLNGVSAAAGKLGAFAGSLLFKEAVTVLQGVGPVLVICALFSLAGGALTMAFVDTDDEEPVVVFADQDSNVDDFSALPGSEHGGPGTNGHGSTGSRIAPDENLSMSDQLSREHTPIKGTYRRVEGTTEIGQEYGVFNQDGVYTLAGNGVFNEGNGGNRSVDVDPSSAASRTNPTV